MPRAVRSAALLASATLVSGLTLNSSPVARWHEPSATHGEVGPTKFVGQPQGLTQGVDHYELLDRLRAAGRDCEGAAPPIKQRILERAATALRGGTVTVAPATIRSLRVVQDSAARQSRHFRGVGFWIALCGISHTRVSRGSPGDIEVTVTTDSSATSPSVPYRLLLPGDAPVLEVLRVGQRVRVKAQIFGVTDRGLNLVPIKYITVVGGVLEIVVLDRSR